MLRGIPPTTNDCGTGPGKGAWGLPQPLWITRWRPVEDWNETIVGEFVNFLEKLLVTSQAAIKNDGERGINFPHDDCSVKLTSDT